MTNSPIDEIKNRLDVVEIIQSYLRLSKTGANYRALCPFHSEKTPSLFVSPVRQIWHCFGCGKGGNIFQFVMEIEGIEFGDALRILAQKAGIELKKQDPKIKTERQRLYEICELVTKFFEKQLELGKAGGEAKSYLLKRGINEASIKNWRLGYAPDSWQGLSDFLVKSGYSESEIEKAGLSLKSSGGDFYDRFRKRIIFPILDLNSQVIGFGGRIIGERKNEKEAKYINTPNTLIYDKSRVLYGLDRAKVEIRKKDCCILAEGYTDVIMSHQEGFENVVATSGTALTPYQLKILRRYSENLLTAFDMDIAGDSATKRGIDLAQVQGFNIKVMRLPEKDPADVIAENPKNWGKLIQEAKSILEFYFETTFSKFPLKEKEIASGEKKEISKVLLPVIKRVPNKIEQSLWLQELSKRLGVKEEVIIEELNKIRTEKPDGEVKDEKIILQPRSRKELLEEKIVMLLLKCPQVLPVINKDNLLFFSPRIQDIFSHLSASTEISPLNAEYLNYISLKAEVFDDGEVSPEKEIELCLNEAYRLDLKDKLGFLTQEIKKAEELKDFEKVNNLIEEFNQTSQKLHSS